MRKGEKKRKNVVRKKHKGIKASEVDDITKYTIYINLA